MQKEQFKGWLIQEKQFGGKTAGDIVSRCGRVERLLNIDLEESLKTVQQLDDLLDRMAPKLKPHLRAGADAVVSISILRRAIRLYAQFLGIEFIVKQRIYSK